MKYKHYIWKNKIENIFLFPFILLGRLIAMAFPLKKEYDIFFFFPFYHTGGAEKVHAQITHAIGNNRSIVFFTRKSADENFLHEFQSSKCTIKDISTYTDNKFIYFLNLIYRGLISGYINRQNQPPVVFNGQCNFGYKISPWLNKTVPQVELIHSFNTFSWIRLPFLPFITHTVMISKVRIDDHLAQYRKLQVPVKFNSRIQHIVNGIALPPAPTIKKSESALQVLYAGRGTEEKRVHLVAEIAKACAVQHLPVQFTLMGDVENAVPANTRSLCRLIGQINEPAKIDEVYQQSHVLIITSYTEGFPMVIEEAMAHGCVIMGTPVGDIPLHISAKHGFVFSTSTDEATIIKEGVAFLSLLCRKPEMISSISKENIAYAKAHYSIEAFNQSYRSLIDTLSAKS